MELSSQVLIDSLLAGMAPVRRKRTSLHSPAVSAPEAAAVPAALRPARRCRCGVCAKCRENARWDEIFEKKFADPNYYSSRAPHHWSPLNEF